MNKRKLPVYQLSSEYADCLEKAFSPRGKVAAVAASEGGDLPLGENDGELNLGAKGNTPLSTRHHRNIGAISEDTVHMSVWVDWGLDADQLFARLHRSQRESQGKAEKYAPEEDNATTDLSMYYDPMQIDIPHGTDEYDASMLPEYFIEGHDNGMLEFGDILWKVSPNGIGGKDGRSYYRYVIKSGGVLIGFRKDKHETVSNMWIEVGSIPLAANGGFRNVWNDLLKMFKKEGITVMKDIVSRVDIYADFDVSTVEEFCTHFTEGKRISRARKVGNYAEDINTATYMVGLRQTGFSIGQNIKLRCYDKRLELEKDPIKWGYFSEKYNGIPEILTRVEFQLRRVALKEFLFNGKDRIDGVESYFAAREQLWKYLTEDWFRLTEEKPDSKNGHQNRATTWTIWEVVQNAVGKIVKEIFRHKRMPRIDMDQLFKQGLGCLCKGAVWELGEEVTPGDVVRYLIAKIKDCGVDVVREVIGKHVDEHLLKAGHFGICLGREG